VLIGGGGGGGGGAGGGSTAAGFPREKSGSWGSWKEMPSSCAAKLGLVATAAATLVRGEALAVAPNACVDAKLSSTNTGTRALAIPFEKYFEVATGG
tara:strand:+ start:1514 stop:1804 length:291 start_codon:yes stop_codon:yes gene_type:complete